MKENVILDNWSIEKIAIDVYEHKSVYKSNKELVHLIESIILWDNIYYLKNDYSTGWEGILSYFSDVSSIFTPINVKEESSLYEECKQKYLKNFANIFDDTVVHRAIEYLLICEKLGYNYFPVNERAKFIDSNKDIIFNNLNKNIDEINIGNNFSKEISKRVNQYVENKSNSFTLTIPPIAQYIINEAQSDNIYDVILTALELRERKDICRFRSDIHKISEYDKLSLSKYKDLIDYDIKILTDSVFPRINKIGIEIAMKILPIGLSGTIDLTPKPKPPISNVFLKKVIKNMVR